MLCNLVFGELIQAKRDMSSSAGAKDPNLLEGALAERRVRAFDAEGYFDSYTAKTYYKTASLISLGCRGIGLLMDFKDTESHRNFFNFGAHLGIAFQIHDDILDFTQSEAQLGKPAFNDLKEGIVTAPIIYALLEQ